MQQNSQSLEQDIKSRYRALQTVLNVINELRQLRKIGSPSQDELLDIENFINGQINNYKSLVKDLNHKIGS